MDGARPKRVYHYTNANALLGIVNSGAMWASKVHYLNDSKEFAHSVEIALEVISSMEGSPSAPAPWTLTTLRDTLALSAQINVFVCSFSAVSDSLSQWRAYCPTGGYSLGFDTELLAEAARAEGFRMCACEYDRAAQRKLLASLLTDAVARLERSEGSQRAQEADRIMRNFVELAPTLKDTSFREESEWRLVSAPILTSEDRWRTRVGKSMLIPYVEVKLRGADDRIPLSEVVVGPTPHPELARYACWSAVKQHVRQPDDVRDSEVPFRDW